MTAYETVGALDVGGTHVTAGRVRLATRDVEPGSRMRIQLDGAATRSALIAAIARAAASVAAPRIGVAVPGPFDYAAGVSRIAHKLDGLYGVDLGAELRGLPGLEAADIRFMNDAEAFVLGEAWAGAARGHRRVVGVTLGSGLGCAFVDDGRIVREGPEAYELPFRGAPVEDVVSARAVRARYGSSVGVEWIAQQARAGDPRARSAFEELGRALGEFLAPLLRPFEPSCLVVGGSVARSWTLFERPLGEELESVAALELVTVADHLDDAPLLGAARWTAQ